MTEEDIEAEYWAHWFYENPPGDNGAEDTEWDTDALIAQINAEAEERERAQSEASDEWEDVIKDGNVN